VGHSKTRLYGIAPGVLSNRKRSSDRRIWLTKKVSGLAQGTVDDPDVIVVRAERDAEVMDALSKLKDSDREILMLSTWEELTAPEIAVTLSISISISTSAAEQRLHRATQRFAEHLKDIHQDAPFTPRAVKEGGGR
jgi:DNA-directed RNA polymerase specialized sigma24 family protein